MTKGRRSMAAAATILGWVFFLGQVNAAVPHPIGAIGALCCGFAALGLMWPYIKKLWMAITGSYGWQ